MPEESLNLDAVNPAQPGQYTRVIFGDVSALKLPKER